MNLISLSELNQKWAIIEDLPRQGSYDLLLVSSKSHAEVSIAISPNAERCLILGLPQNFSADFNEIVKENLRLNLLQEQNYVSITLQDKRFIDLFDDLIISIHNAITEIQEVEEYCRVFLETFHKWSKFFEPLEDNSYSELVIRGIVGELLVLRELIVEEPSAKINVLLNGWRGPYDQNRDFIFEDHDIEVKTRTTANACIKIANENQLDQLEGKGLTLVAVTIERDEVEGKSLSDLVREILRLIEAALGDSSIFYKALRQKNLGSHNLSEYDHLNFKAYKMDYYDCLLSGFPSLTRSQLPSTILKISYSLNTAELESFIVKENVL